MEHKRIIYILDYIRKYTDDTKCVSIKQIQTHLEQNYNIKSVSPITIRRDMDRLITLGYHITTEVGAHNTFFYRMKHNGFTFNEIRFLVDSVSINKYLSVDQKQHLIKKFEGLCSESEVRKLISRIQMNDLTPVGLNLLENLEQIHLIIAEKQKIDFEYGKYKGEQIEYYKKRRNMLPCQVIFFEDRFYLKCMNEEDEKVRTYRIDRMRKIHPGEKVKKTLIPPKPKGVVLDMFEPKYYENVKFRVKSFLVGDMKEKFGEYIHIRKDENDTDCNLIWVKVGISDSFFRWVMKYGSNIEILSPQSLRIQYQQELQKVLALYQDGKGVE